MPELPEVETVRRALAPVLEGARIEHVETMHPRVLRRQPRPADFHDRLQGRTVRSVGRHGKFLIMDLNGDLTWVTHLGMSGRITIENAGVPAGEYTRASVTVSGERVLHFIDPRTFGFMAVYTPDELAAEPFRAMGPDALLELPRRRRLEAQLQGRTAPIKALLLDQHIVAGLGNIYADEVLHRAGIRPDRPGGSLSSEEIGRMRAAIRPILEAGLRYGGTSLNDLAYLLPDGRSGDYLSRLRVYGRADQPCKHCGTPIERMVIRSRSSYWCRTCQR